MKPELFRMMVEHKLIAENIPVAVEYNVYDNGKKKGVVKGLYTISKVYAHPLFPGTRIDITNGTETTTIDPTSLKLVSGLPPIKLAAQHGIRPDGKENDAPKRRGRKPKVRFAEQEFSEADFE